MHDLLAQLGLIGRRFALAKKIACIGCLGVLCLCKGSGQRFVPAVFEDVTLAVTWLEDATDAWITGNPVKAGVHGRPLASDVEASPWLLLDADPEKTPSDPDGLSEESRSAAHDLAAEAWEALGRSGILVDSGRGAQVWIRVAEGVPRRRLLRYIAQELQRPGVKVDATHDPSRLMRLPGYENSRTGRTAMILSPREGEEISVAEAHELLEGFADVQAEEADAEESFDRSAPTAADGHWLRGEALKHWNAEGDGDRSLRDFIFLRLLLSSSCPESVACRLLWSLPGGKANEDKRDARYWGATLQSVYKTLAEEAARRDRLSSLINESADDPAAPFASQALEDLAWLQRWDTQGWQRMRVDLKGLKSFRLSDLEKEIGKTSVVLQGPPDDVVRCIVRNGEEAFWLVRAGIVEGGWVKGSHATVQACLRATVEGGADSARKAAVLKPWVWTSLPFAPRWLEGRGYNASSAQWRISPAEGLYPMWEQLLTVVGRGLDVAVAADSWCKKNELPDGACYLFAWLSSLSQRPEKSTAYLFCFSEKENLGKSMLHEAIRKHLLQGGIVKADKALMNDRGFNAELEGAVFCTVEEANLGRARSLVHERMKDLITGDDIGLEGKGADVRDVKNYTHWYQTANRAAFCPLFKGDSRITAWEMQPPKRHEKIQKEEMHEALSIEAPAFLHALLSFPLPTHGDGRLAIPAVGTVAKAWQQEASRSLLEVWMEARPDWVALPADDLVMAAQRWLQLRGEDLRYWRRATILRSLPSDASTMRLRTGAEAIFALTVPFEGTSAKLANGTGWGNAKSMGHLVAQLMERGVSGITRTRSNGVRIIKIDRSTTT